MLGTDLSFRQVGALYFSQSANNTYHMNVMKILTKSLSKGTKYIRQVSGFLFKGGHFCLTSCLLSCTQDPFYKCVYYKRKHYQVGWKSFLLVYTLSEGRQRKFLSEGRQYKFDRNTTKPWKCIFHFKFRLHPQCLPLEFIITHRRRKGTVYALPVCPPVLVCLSIRPSFRSHIFVTLDQFWFNV